MKKIIFWLALACSVACGAAPNDSTVNSWDKSKWIEFTAGIGYVGNPKVRVSSRGIYSDPPRVTAKDPFMARLGVAIYPFRFMSVGVNADYYGLSAGNASPAKTNMMIALSGRVDFNAHLGNDMIYGGGQYGPIFNGGKNLPASTVMPTKGASAWNMHVGYRLQLIDQLWAWGEVGYMRQNFTREIQILFSNEIQSYQVSSVPIMLGLNCRI